MKKEFKKHLLPLIVFFTLVSIIWIFTKVSYFEFIFLFFGLFFGSFFLDLDYLLFWFYIKPNLDESKQAREYLQNKQFKEFIHLFFETKENHKNLIFHHYFAQIVLALISFFVFTSSNSIFAMSFIWALNAHLVIDEIYDYSKDPKDLQNWLFARESKQLPVAYLKHYIITFIIICLFFAYLLVKSAI